jgi:hypothetical protein
MSQSVEARLSGLKNLPDLEPPAGLEAATLAAMAAVGEERHRFPLGQAAVWVALTVAGLLLGALAFDIGGSGEQQSESISSADGSNGLAGGGSGPADATAPPDAVDEDDFLALLELSNYLEQVLAALPQREVMRVSTAGTIAGLEQQIAQIDEALWTTGSETIAPEYRVTLMRDRVETMNALLNVRYSQSRAFSY